MSAAMASSTNHVTIYVRLLNEGTTVYRPTSAVAEGLVTYRLGATEGYDPNDEPPQCGLAETSVAGDLRLPRRVLATGSISRAPESGEGTVACATVC